jgi:hypothetical protein
MERRTYDRKLLDPIHVEDIQVIDHLAPLARCGVVLNASASGLLIEIQRCDLNPEFLYGESSLDSVCGDNVMMKVVEMSLEIDGTIVRAKETAQGAYEIAIDFAANAPAYWRECFAEFLPKRGEIDAMQRAHLN